MTNAEVWLECKKYAIQQKEEEFLPLLDLLKNENAKRIISIGVHSGGTDRGFLSFADSVVAMDLFKHENINKLEEEFADKFLFVCANSHEENTFKLIKGLTLGEKIDVLFIDGDYEASGVMKDFQMYSKLVRPGGMVIFHDILPSDHHHMLGCNVDVTWDILKKQYKSLEIILDEVANPWAGIGVLWMP